MPFPTQPGQIILPAGALLGNEQVPVVNAGPQGVSASVVNIVNFAGSTITTAPVSVTSSTTFVTTGLQASLQAGTYIFDAYLSVTNGAGGGIKVVGGGTAVASLFVADTWSYNLTTVAAQTNVTSEASNLVAYTGSITTINCTGTIVVSTAGTFNIQFAQNVSNGTATTVNSGSYLWIERVA